MSAACCWPNVKPWRRATVLGRLRKDRDRWRKDAAFRLERDGWSAEELYPLAVGYSPYSGMTPLKKPTLAAAIADEVGQ